MRSGATASVARGVDTGLPRLDRVNDAPPPEPDEAPPWRPEMGPEPRVTVYPRGREPGLYVWAGGVWRYGLVAMRHDWADGRVAYHVDVALDGVSTGRRAYWWGQPGLRMAHG